MWKTQIIFSLYGLKSVHFSELMTHFLFCPYTCFISPQPISLKLFSTLLLIAILSPIFAQTGFVNSTRTIDYLTDMILAASD